MEREKRSCGERFYINEPGGLPCSAVLPVLHLPIYNVLNINNKSEPISDWIKVRIILFWWRRRGSNSRPYGCEPYALPAELRPHLPPIFQRQKVLYHKIFNCKERFFLENKNFQLPIAQGYSKINKLLVEKSSASSCGAGLAQCNPANHVRRGTEQH